MNMTKKEKVYDGTEITAVLKAPGENEELHFSFINMSFVDDEDGGYAGDYFFYPDEKGTLLSIDYDVIKPDIPEILLNAPYEFFDTIEKKGTNYIPYWTAFKIKDGTEIIAFKSYHDISYNDVGYLSLFFLTAYFIAALIFVILVVNIIRTHRNSRNIRKIVFRDNITGNKNWFRFAYTAKHLLKRRKLNT